MTLSVQGAAYDYGEGRGLRATDLTLAATPQLIALTGPNGSGKSTLLKLLARVAAPSSGEIAFEGKRLREWPAKEYAKRVAYLPQDPDPSFPMRAIDVVVSGRAPMERKRSRSAGVWAAIPVTASRTGLKKPRASP